MIIYRGPSLIDNKPIVVIAVYPKKKANAKTGVMVQTYILADNGFDPMFNNKTGLDFSICGNCKHKGTPTDNPDKKLALNRSCYVNLMHGPGQVYKAFKKGNYKQVQTPDDIAELVRIVWCAWVLMVILWQSLKRSGRPSQARLRGGQGTRTSKATKARLMTSLRVPRS